MVSSCSESNRKAAASLGLHLPWSQASWDVVHFEVEGISLIWLLRAGPGFSLLINAPWVYNGWLQRLVEKTWDTLSVWCWLCGIMKKQMCYMEETRPKSPSTHPQQVHPQELSKTLEEPEPHTLATRKAWRGVWQVSELGFETAFAYMSYCCLPWNSHERAISSPVIVIFILPPLLQKLLKC